LSKKNKIKDFPEELVKIFKALSNKDCRKIILQLWDDPIEASKIDKKKVRPLVYAAMVHRWTTGDFSQSYYEMTMLGRDVIKTITSVFKMKVLTPNERLDIEASLKEIEEGKAKKFKNVEEFLKELKS